MSTKTNLALILSTLAASLALASTAPPAQAAQSTTCSLAGTVCATAIAEGTVSCGSNWGVRHCTAVGTVGGHGASGLGVSGWLSWSGGVCGSDRDRTCGATERASAACSWGGGTAGCGGTKSLTVGTFTCFLCTARGYVYSTSSATARSSVALGVGEDVTAHASQHRYATSG